MRTIVDIPEASLHQLAAICQQEDVSRAEVIRRAVNHYVTERQKRMTDKDAEFQNILHKTAGIWKDEPFWETTDSIAYVRKIRDEWEDPWERG